MKHLLLVGSRVALAVATISPVAAYAQDTDAVQPPDQGTASESSRGLDEIVVTARKVAENLQDVPVAVTALSGDTLERQNVTRVDDLARLAPGLTMRAGTSQASAVNFQLRGQYQNEILATLDPSVGSYVDGFYWARAFGLNADLVDVQSVQILRGPQGTLFGRNTTGGAMLIQTNDPDADEFSGMVSATYGRFNTRSATGVLNIPIVEDKIALRVAGNVTKRDGYVNSVPFVYNGIETPTTLIKAFPFGGDNVTPGSVGRKLGNRDNYTLRAKLLVKPTDNLSLVLSAEQFHFDAFAQNWRLAVVDTRAGTTANTEAGLELGATAANAQQVGRDFYAAYIPWTQNSDNVALNEDGRYYTKTQTYLGTATLDTFFGQVKFTGGFRNIKASNNIDLDGSPIAIIDTQGFQDLSQYSGELQFTGKAANDRIDFAAGLFYFKEYGFDSSRAITLPMNATQTTGQAGLNRSRLYGEIETRSQGVYGQATFHLNDNLSFVGGLRYSVEDKGLTVFNRTERRLTGALVTCSLTAGNPASTPQPCQAQRSDDFKGVSYTAGINYQFDDTLLYLKTSKGFRSGGQQLRATGGTGGFVPFRPEISYEHELGVKTELFDRRLRFNLAIFRNTTSDLQRGTINVFSEGGALRTATIIGNAGKSRTYGGEVEATFLVTDGFTIALNAAHIKPKYLDYSSPNGTTGLFFDRRSERFDQVPEWQWGANANYEHDFDWGRFNLNANYSWQDTTAIRDINFVYDTAAGLARDVSSTAVYSIPTAQAIIAATTQKSGGQLDLRASLAIMDGKLELSAWGRNVTNFRPNVAALVFSAPIAAVSVQKRDPSIYGGTISYKF